MKLWLDDERDPVLFGFADWTWVKTAPAAVQALMTGTVTRASLDHDLGLCWACARAHTPEDIARVRASLIRTPGPSYSSCPHNGTGYDVVCWMEANQVWPPNGVRVHSMNPIGRARMEHVIRRAYERTA